MIKIGDKIWDNQDKIPEWPESTPIKDFYKGKNVFLTGTTGSVGHLILQKLIRLDVNQIYVHIREKKGINCNDRLKDIFENVVMERAIKYNKNCMSKITIIEGDLEERNLGMSESDINKLIENVEIVFAVAADVRFTQPLRHAVNSNVRSVYDLLKIAEKMQKLQSFIFMSTAFSNNSLYCEEKFYDLPMEPEVLFNFVDNIGLCSDETLSGLTQKVIAPWANTYTYTKNIAEYLVLKYRNKLPVAIIRPSIIIGTDQEPVPGWTGNIFGVNGIIIGFGTGTLRIMYCDGNLVGDMIPGDYVSNSTLALAHFVNDDWTSPKNSIMDEAIESHVPIYNCVSSTDNPVTWNEIRDSILSLSEFATVQMVWFYTANYENSWSLFKFYNLLYHVIPTFFIDKFLAWRNDKVRLIRIYRTMFYNINLIAYFMKSWKFDSTNMRNIYDRMTPEDHKIFPCDIRILTWSEFLKRHCIGFRVFWMKDPLTTMAKAQRKLFRLRMAHYIVRSFYLSFVAYLSYKLLQFSGVLNLLHITN